MWVIQIWSLLFLLPLLLIILSNWAVSGWLLLLLMVIHEVVVERLCHAWREILVLIFGIIRSWAWSKWWYVCSTVIIDMTIHVIAWNAIVSPRMSGGFFEFLIERRSDNWSLIIGRLLGLLRFLLLHWLLSLFIGLLHGAVRNIDTSTFQTVSAYLFARLYLGMRRSVNYLWAISVVSSTTDYWSIIVIFIRVLVLKGRWRDLIEIWLFPKVISLHLWHHRFLIKMWWSICNLDWLCVMRIRSLLCIIVISSRGSPTLLSLMIVVFEIWINRNEILLLYNRFFGLLYFLPPFWAATSLCLLFWIFASRCFRLWHLTGYAASNQLLMMSL
jgi:hypothetical protein